MSVASRQSRGLNKASRREPRDMATIRPRPGFDWSRVKFTGPYLPDHCSYCGDEIPDDDNVPLWLFEKHGDKSAVFCEHCQIAWWGLRPVDEERIKPRHEPEV